MKRPDKGGRHWVRLDRWSGAKAKQRLGRPLGERPHFWEDKHARYSFGEAGTRKAQIALGWGTQGAARCVRLRCRCRCRCRCERRVEIDNGGVEWWWRWRWVGQPRRVGPVAHWGKKVHSDISTTCHQKSMSDQRKQPSTQAKED